MRGGGSTCLHDVLNGSPPQEASMNTANALNQGCMCLTLDADRLREQLERDPSLKGLSDSIALSQPHLFSNSVVFMSTATHQAIAQAVEAIERVMALPAYQAAALELAPPIAQHAFGPLSAFMGYDFHVDGNNAPFIGPQLIEINTNAGGAFLNAALARAHLACCESMSLAMETYTRLETLEQTFFDMFQHEWQLQRGSLQSGGVPLRTVAIVDDAPQTQYLAPEFALCRQMFMQRGVQAIIADPKDLRLSDGRLWHGDLAIDLVYNRLTDFDLSSPAHQALREAYVTGATVVTPHPGAHALRANKRNLITLSSDDLLNSWGVTEADRQCLRDTVPATQAVTRAKADALWAQRRQLFFKPVSGYGGKAAYRGDKLTRKVWEDILAGDFIAQALVPPGQRLVNVEGTATHLKFDIRAYTYNGQIQLLVARTYSGQTTNFRTPGGGFSPVLIVPQMALPPGSQPSLAGYELAQPEKTCISC
jgi:hypothetical protein